MDDDLAQASEHFNGGIIFLSFLVSVIGTQTTLLLLSRRTYIHGAYNWFLLVTASLIMGSVGVWTMHFIGNLSLTLKLKDGVQTHQLAYQPGYTVASFIVAVTCMFIAFAFVGISEEVHFLRILPCGLFAGAGIACMHYLGQFAIDFFVLRYITSYVIAAIIIACTAVTISLYIFFKLRQTWKNQWYKSLLCAMLMAVAVCGMHYTAMAGTLYYYPDGQEPPPPVLRPACVIGLLVAVFFPTCAVLIYVSIKGGIRVISTYQTKKKASRLVLNLAIFDLNDRLMVQTDGCVPSREVVPDLHKFEGQQEFSVRHPLFIRLFNTVLYWTTGENDRSRLQLHLAGSAEYDSLEIQFEKVARELRDSLQMSSLSELGILYDSVVHANTAPAPTRKPNRYQRYFSEKKVLAQRKNSDTSITDRRWSLESSVTAAISLGGETLVNAIDEELRRMSAVSHWSRDIVPDTDDRHLFLLRRIKEQHEASRLLSIGYRFADPMFISRVMGTKLSIPHQEMRLYFQNMQQMTSGVSLLNRACQSSSSEPKDYVSQGEPAGVYVGLFAVIQDQSDEDAHTLVYKERRGSFPIIQLQYLDGELPSELNTNEKRLLKAMHGKTLESILSINCDAPFTSTDDIKLKALSSKGSEWSIEDIQRFLPALQRTVTTLMHLSECIRTLNPLTSLKGEVINVPSFALTIEPCELILFKAHVVESAIIDKVNRALQEPIKCVPLQLFRALAYYITDQMVEDFRFRRRTNESSEMVERQRQHFVSTRLSISNSESILSNYEHDYSEHTPSIASLPPPPRKHSKSALPNASYSTIHIDANEVSMAPPLTPSDPRRPSLLSHYETINAQPTILEVHDRFWWLEGLITDTMNSSV